MKFLKEVTVALPYDTERLQSELEFSALFTYFYNVEKGYWERLERVNIDKEQGVVVSLTNHFTDLINSTLALPESPDPLSFNPNSIKDIKAADPAANIPQIQGLKGGPFGAAQFRLPLTIPPGRAGLAPDLSLNYSSGTPNGWLGVGFDMLRLSSIIN
jgi:hypothetical protein